MADGANTRRLLAAGWVRRDGHECDMELARGGMCARPGRWYHPGFDLRGRPVCSQHALQQTAACRPATAR